MSKTPQPPHYKASFTPKELKPALDYITMYWHKLRFYWPKDEGSLIGLPHPYFVPSREETEGFRFEEMYYWDSYFIALGLLNTPNQEHAWGMVENMLTLIERFHRVPNANRFYLTSRSQPPFLSSLVLQLYQFSKNKSWLKRCMEIAEYEYEHVWLGTVQPHRRYVFQGLSRYYDANVLHDLAEAESGWDYTNRFNRRCLQFVPICLNSLLFKYEKDFAETARILSDSKKQIEWEQKAEARKQACNYYMWNEKKGFFFDFDYVNLKQSPVWSLAGFYPLWAGMATKDQAKKMVAHLNKFEHQGGLATTDIKPKQTTTIDLQWVYPNGWAPLQYLLIYGLKLYGYSDDAERIARKWLRCNLDVFERDHAFHEKYNVVNPLTKPTTGMYPDQIGFGWTNAIFHRLCLDFLHPNELPETVGKKLPRRVSLQTHLKAAADRKIPLASITKKQKRKIQKISRSIANKRAAKYRKDMS